MPWKAAGATPTTVKVRPERVTVLPTIAGSSWKRRCHSSAPSTTTGWFSSLVTKPRPRIMRSSATSKKFAVTAWPHTRSGSPRPPMEAGTSRKVSRNTGE